MNGTSVGWWIKASIITGVGFITGTWIINKVQAMRAASATTTTTTTTTSGS